MTTLPVSIVGARFLGSRDRIAVAGTVSSKTTEVRVLGLGLGGGEDGGGGGNMEYITSGSAGLAGTCTAMELCEPHLCVLLDCYAAMQCIHVLASCANCVSLPC
jgi:hypothetical protein